MEGVEEFYENRIGNALERLQELKPGQQISFVGLRVLAEELVREAGGMGLRIRADFKEGFNDHLLTLLGKMELEPVPEEVKEIRSLLQWFRVTFGSLMRFIRGSSL